MNKLLTKIAKVVLGLSLAAGVGVAIGSKKIAQRADASEEIAYTLNGTTTGGSSGYDTASSITQNSVSWSVTGNTTMSPWRIGGKSLSGVSRLVKSNGVVSTEDITKVVLTTGASSGSITVNSLKLYVGTASGGSQTSTVTGTYAASSNITFTKPSGADWSSKYFTLDFNVTVSGTSNKYVTVSSVTFYYESASVVTYSVTYAANGATSGSVPTDNTAYTSGGTVTVLGNTGNLAKTNYDFGGWTDGTHDYAAGDTFEISGNTTLTAIWNYNVRYTDDTTAKTITWDLTMPEYESASATSMSWTSPKATMLASKGSASTATNNYCPPANSSTRFYKNSSLAITPVGSYKITSIVFEATSENYANAIANSTWTNATASASTTTVTVTPTDVHGAVSAVLSDTAGVTEVVVNYAENGTLTSIAVSGSMTNTEYSAGGAWDPTGLVVTATYSDSSTGDVTSSVTWTYNPASPSSTSITSVTATASYTEGGVTRTADSSAQAVTVISMTIDTITVDDTDATGTSYVLTTGITKNTAVYSSQNAHATEANGNGLQYRTTNSNSGIVSTTSGGLIKSVTITYPEGKSGQMDIYGKNTAYTNPTDLYSDSLKGTLLGSISSTGSLAISDDYQYIGVRSSSGARYLTSIAFTWEAYDPTAPSISIDQAGSEQEIGATGTLTATIANAGDNTVSWSSSDPSVISIDSSSGAWSAIKMGAVEIIATLGTTGKKSTIDMSVTGNVNVARARDIIDTLEGADSPYRVTISGYVISASGDGTKNGNNSINIADSADGTDLVQIYIGYNAVSNWSDVSTVGAKIKAKGTLLKYNSTYELKNPVDIEVVDSDRAAVEEFVNDYMHMDYTSNLGYCSDQAHGYYLAAKAAFNDLTAAQQLLFKTDSEFSAEKARFEAWAVANRDADPYDGYDDIHTPLSVKVVEAVVGAKTNTITVIIIVSLVSITAIGGYFFIKRRQEN